MLTSKKVKKKYHHKISTALFTNVSLSREAHFKVDIHKRGRLVKRILGYNMVSKVRQCRYHILAWYMYMHKYVSFDTMSQYCLDILLYHCFITLFLCCSYTSWDHHIKKYLMMSPESLTPSLLNKQITTAINVTNVQYHGTWSSNLKIAPGKSISE